MEINQEVLEILEEFKIGKDAGLLCLLGIYYGLDVDSVVPEEIVKAINLTKIVDIDYDNRSIVWKVPLFAGQEIAFGWVKEWIDGFGKINPERRGSYASALSRMKTFFAKYPQYRQDDVFKARNLYFTTVRDSKFLMKSHKFIFDGAGAMKNSTLLEYCEKVAGASDANVGQQKGKVLT